MGQNQAKMSMIGETPPPLFTYDPVNGMVPNDDSVKNKDTPHFPFFPEDIDEFPEDAAAACEVPVSSVDITAPGFSVSNPYEPATVARKTAERPSEGGNESDSEVDIDDENDSLAPTRPDSLVPIQDNDEPSGSIGSTVPLGSTATKQEEEVAIFLLPDSMEPVGAELERPRSGMYDEVCGESVTAEEKHSTASPHRSIASKAPPTIPARQRVKIETFESDAGMTAATQYDTVYETPSVNVSPRLSQQAKHVSTASIAERQSVSTHIVDVARSPAADVGFPAVANKFPPTLPEWEKYPLDYSLEEESVVERLSRLVMIDSVLWQSAPDTAERRRSVEAAWHAISLNMGITSKWTFERYVRLWRTLALTLTSNPENMTWRYFKYLSFFLPLLRQLKPANLMENIPQAHAVPVKQEIPSTPLASNSTHNGQPNSSAVSSEVSSSEAQPSTTPLEQKTASKRTSPIAVKQDTWTEFEDDFIPPAKKRLTLSPRKTPAVPKRRSLGQQPTGGSNKSGGGGLFSRMPPQVRRGKDTIQK